MTLVVDDAKIMARDPVNTVASTFFTVVKHFAATRSSILIAMVECR